MGLKVTQGIIPDNCIENSVIGIDTMSITYYANADTNSDKDDVQFLTIETRNNGSGEDGTYYNISIKNCDHWSINDPEELAEIFEDFIARFNLNITKEKDLKTYGK